MSKKWHKGKGYLYRHKKGKLEIKLAKRITLSFNKSDESDIDVGIAKLAQAKLDKYAKLGKIFKVSKMTVSNKVDKAESCGIKGLIDGRSNNGGSKKLTPEIIRAIIFEVVTNPIASNAEIVENIYNRTGKRISTKTLAKGIKESGACQIAWDLNTLGMNGTNGHAESEVLTFSRYGAHMMDLVYLERLNFEKATEKISLYMKNGYKDKEFYLTLYNLYAVGEQRLYDLETVSQDELGCLTGMDRHMQSSGAQKRLNKVVNFCDVEGFKEESLREYYKAGLLDIGSAYCDTHVGQVYPAENVYMARHGTKNKNVKAINKHFLVTAAGRILNFILTQGRHKLSEMILPMVDQVEKIFNKKLKDVSYDKGGSSIKVLTGLKKRETNFITWGKKSKYVVDQISKIPLTRYRIMRKEKIREKGRKPVIRVVEKIADTTTYLKGWGKIRTILVLFLENNELRWIYTDIPRKKCSALKIRDKIRYKQREENLFKKMVKMAFDCFAGGMAKAIRIRRPKKDEIPGLRRRIKSSKSRLKKNRNVLKELKQKYNLHLIPEDMYLREKKIIDAKIENYKQRTDQLKETINWAKGGKKPKFISTRYELNLTKQTLLDVIQCWVLMVQELMKKEFLECLQKTFKEEGYQGRALGKKMSDVDTTLVSKILFGQQAKIIRNDKKRIIRVIIAPAGRESLHKALTKYISKINSYNTKIDYGREKKYKLEFSTPKWKPRSELPGGIFGFIGQIAPPEV